MSMILHALAMIRVMWAFRISNNSHFVSTGQNPSFFPEYRMTHESRILFGEHWSCFDGIFCFTACLLQTDNPSYEKVKLYCDNVLEVAPNNVKALYRRGVAAYHLRSPDDALIYLKQAGNEPDGKKGNWDSLYRLSFMVLNLTWDVCVLY